MVVDRWLEGTRLKPVYLRVRYSGVARFFLDPRVWEIRGRKLQNVAATVRHPGLLPLHHRLRRSLRAQKRAWPHHRFALGHYYQGWKRIGIHGFRSTEERFAFYGIERFLDNDVDVLDIGANAGFFSLAIAQRAHHVDAVELNPHMMSMGEAAARHLGIRNVTFHLSDFQEFVPPRRYGLIVSCAVHHTDDGQMRPGLRRHLERLASMLKPGGRILFESHRWEPDDPTFLPTIAAMAPLLRITEKRHEPREGRWVLWMQKGETKGA